MNISYILNINLQRSFIMIKIIGKLIALMVKGEYSLKEGQHLQEDRDKHVRL